MPLIVLLLGVALVSTGFRGSGPGVLILLGQDLGGKNGFFLWVLGFMAIGLLGYYKPLKPLSQAFLLLAFMALLFTAKSGFLANLGPQLDAIAGAPATAQK